MDIWLPYFTDITETKKGVLLNTPFLS